MFKTIALFFVLGLMVSCASHREGRGVASSLENQETKHGYYERAPMGGYR